MTAPVVLSQTDEVGKRLLSSGAQHMLSCIVASCLLVVGLTCQFGSCAPVEGLVAFCVAGLVATIAFQVASARGVSRAVLRIAGLVVVALTALSALVLAPFRAGLFSFGNQIVSRIDDVFHVYLPLFPVTEATQASLVFYVLMGLVAAFVIWLVISRRAIVVLTVLVFASGGFGIVVGTGWPLLAFGCTLVAWFASWRLMLGNSALSLRTTAVAFVAAALAVGVSLGTGSLYQPAAAVDALRGGIVQGVTTLRYGEDTQPEGDLKQAATMQSGDDSRLVIGFSSEQRADLHLRGFVGASLSDTQWLPLDHTAYEGSWTGLFSWLGTQQFAPQAQRAAFNDENMAQGEAFVEESPITVQTTGANRAYVYAPYAVSTVDEAAVTADRDGSLLASGVRGQRSYTLQVDQVDTSVDVASTPAWLIDGTSDTDSYVESESVYRSFVYEHYLDISDEDKQLVDELFYGDPTWKADDSAPVSTVVSRVRIMLSTLASYTDEPATLPEGTNFLSWFLEQQREGNSAYFSTAAVLALRAQGIPARYVEGYLATQSAFDAAWQAGDRSITLTSKDVHAWAEVYLDGIGWTPVEVAPGFYNQAYKADEIIDVNQNMAGGNQKDNQAAGALAGDLQRDDAAPNAAASAWGAGLTALAAFAVVVLLLAASLALLEAWRLRRRSQCVERCASDDQSVAVPALYDQLTRIMKASGIAFDAAYPFEVGSEFAVKFPQETRGEYERAINLIQKAVFGCKELGAHEMRALRRFVERVDGELKPAQGLRQQVVRRYRYLR